MFRDRPTAEVVVLLFALTACSSLLLTGAAIAVVLLLPEIDQSVIELGPTVDFLQTTVGLIIGALLGLLVHGGKRSGPQD